MWDRTQHCQTVSWSVLQHKAGLKLSFLEWSLKTLASSGIKNYKEKLFRFCLVSLVEVYVSIKINKWKGKKYPRQPNLNHLPVKTCRTLDFHTCVHFLNSLSAYFNFDPSSRVEWHTVSIWENAGAELLDCLHAARREESGQAFFPSSFRNKQFHLLVPSIFILYSPWVLMLCSEMWSNVLSYYLKTASVESAR